MLDRIEESAMYTLLYSEKPNKILWCLYFIFYYPIYWSYASNGKPTFFRYGMTKIFIFVRILYSIILSVYISIIFYSTNPYILLTNIPSIFLIFLLLHYYLLIRKYKLF